MKSNKPLLTCLKLFAVCVSLIACPKGPLVDICLVDSHQMAFQCGNQEKKWKLPFDKGEKLVCSSPFDIQQLLVNCHRGILIEVAVCRYSIQKQLFDCKDTDDVEFVVSIEQAENYTCLSENHKQRILNRCLK